MGYRTVTVTDCDHCGADLSAYEAKPIRVAPSLNETGHHVSYFSDTSVRYYCNALCLIAGETNLSALQEASEVVAK